MISFNVNELISSTFILQIDTNLKHVCSNNVIIYNQLEIIKTIIILIVEYQNLFVDKNIIVDIFE